MTFAPGRARLAIALYGLAYLGVHLAFMPLIVLLLPRRVEAIAPDEVAMTLSLLLLVGAVVAGAAHIVAGALSDRWLRRRPNRRGLIILGTAGLGLSYVLLAYAGNLPQLLGALVLFQVTLNFAFAPLGALLADHFPNELKGKMGGIMNAALPASSLTVVLVGWLFPEDGPLGMILTGLLALACIVPLLLLWPLGDAMRAKESTRPGEQPTWALARRDFQIAWCARLAIQIGATFVLGYIYVLLSQVLVTTPEMAAGNASGLLATLSAPASVIAIVATVAAGALSDKAGRRRPLAFAAAIFALGLALLAGAGSLAAFIVGYAVFYVGLSAFLSIDTALVAQLVSASPRRGTLLGIMNLTNTLPAIFAPGLTMLAFSAERIEDVLGLLFLASAGLAILSAMAILLIRTVR